MKIFLLMQGSVVAGGLDGYTYIQQGVSDRSWQITEQWSQKQYCMLTSFVYRHIICRLIEVYSRHRKQLVAFWWWAIFQFIPNNTYRCWTLIKICCLSYTLTILHHHYYALLITYWYISTGVLFLYFWRWHAISLNFLWLFFLMLQHIVVGHGLSKCREVPNMMWNASYC